jgi:hypothetical protein
MTKLSVATSKRYKDASGAWQEKTQWHTCICYGTTADYAAKIQTGAHVFIDGELVHREYERTIETDSGPVKVPWPVTELRVKQKYLSPPGRGEYVVFPAGLRSRTASQCSVAVDPHGRWV